MEVIGTGAPARAVRRAKAASRSARRCSRSALRRRDGGLDLDRAQLAPPCRPRPGARAAGVLVGERQGLGRQGEAAVGGLGQGVGLGEVGAKSAAVWTWRARAALRLGPAGGGAGAARLPPSSNGWDRDRVVSAALRPLRAPSPPKFWISNPAVGFGRTDAWSARPWARRTSASPWLRRGAVAWAWRSSSR